MFRDERGQAAVELLGVLPALLAAGAIAWQLILVGHAAWLSADVARVAARADLVGEDRLRAARSALPAAMERGLAVERTDDGAARVRVAVPSVHRAWRGKVEVEASASLETAP